MNGRVHGIINRTMDFPELLFKGAASIIGATTLWITKTTIDHKSKIAVLESQFVDINNKLDKIIDIHLKSNGGSK